MKQLLLICLSVCLANGAWAQPDSAQQWRDQWQNGTDKTIRLQAAIGLADFYLRDNLDSCMFFSNTALQLSLEMAQHPKLSVAYRLVGSANVNLGNYPSALEYYFRAIDIDDSTANHVSLAVDYFGLFILYAQKSQLDSGFAYLQRGLKIISPTDTGALGYLVPGIARYYLAYNQKDSAFKYASQFDGLVLHWKREDWKAQDWQLLGDIEKQRGKYDKAMDDYHQSFLIAQAAQDRYGICVALIDEATIYDQQYRKGQAIATDVVVLRIAGNQFPNLQLTAASYLSSAYAAYQKWDSAYLFSDMTLGLERKLRNNDSAAAMTNLDNQRREQKKQREEMQQKAREERTKNIQLFSIAFFIPCFYLFVLYLKRRKISQRMVKVFGLFALLMGFEFFNFLMHPWLEDCFHENQYLVFATLVVIALIVARAHHRMEDMVAKRLGGD